MLWEITILPADSQLDIHGAAITHDATDLGFTDLKINSAYGYLIEGNCSEQQIHNITENLLADKIVAKTNIRKIEPTPIDQNPKTQPDNIIYILPKVGVTDTVAENVKQVMEDWGINARAVRTFKKYYITSSNKNNIKGIIADSVDCQSIENDQNRPKSVFKNSLELLATKLLANDAVEQVVFGELPFDHLLPNPITSQSQYDEIALKQNLPHSHSEHKFDLITVPLLNMNDQELLLLSTNKQLYLSLAELQTIKSEFHKLDRNPTDIELETIAQTWSEHCSHKTLAGHIHYTKHNPDGTTTTRMFNNMLKETIFAATEKLIAENPYIAKHCISVFSDNAGIVAFDNNYNVCFKVETHNHPSALEPYGGANTGLGGVIRDPMGTGLGAKPIANTNVFCFAPPNTTDDKIPTGVLHPRRIMKGVVAGVRDYGNRMGIPTVNGAVYFDERYLNNPLVFCGNIGILPKNKSFKSTQHNDLIVVVGGKTGRDGIHGATFSSTELTSESESVSGGAVQIGNAITEKMVLDIMLIARDQELYNAVTDCGAGGLSSAIGEMGEKIGATVELSNTPLKYEGLTYSEIWISESQERMVFAVPAEKWEKFKKLCNSENVEATALGKFEPTGKLILKFHNQIVANINMEFLHKGRPPVIRKAIYSQPYTKLNATENNVAENNLPNNTTCKKNNKTGESYLSDLKQILSSPNIASKHWIIRQYDHEVQGGSIIKPLIGLNNDAPSDAAVVRPLLNSRKGLVIACGMNPLFGDLDIYRMAASGIDEAIRNAIAVGAELQSIVILDNFCWGNTEKPETLGSLVEAAIACYDTSVGFGTPFISGKDSLNNEFRTLDKKNAAIPPTLLISAMGQINDIANCITMDLKQKNNILYQIGTTKNELGGSHFAILHNLKNNTTPTLDIPTARKLYESLNTAVYEGLVESLHDLSEGGLAVAIAEMCFGGNLGATLNNNLDEITLFSESNSRFVAEIHPNNTTKFESIFNSQPIKKIGYVTDKKQIQFGNLFTAQINELKNAWQSTLDFK
ncbi:MAG: phosphoribosylformylglycinamidine synthase subunit PurL [Planctomycetaceae bacterium]|jgi:phosphoribosylformylglycinamidine synthase|nr:phosphoribosylformylglycinamidine synthase subunit PurL [Planctomycetaceae bacterium]